MSVDRLKRDAIDAAQKYKARYKQSLDPNDLDMFKRFMDVYNHLSDIEFDEIQDLQGVTDVGNTTTNTIDTAGTKSDYFLLDTTATPTLQPGMFGWNDAFGTADLRLKGDNVTLQVGQEIIARVVNKTGADLLESEYKVVRVRIASEGGAQGQRLAVVLAQGDNDPDSVTTLGIVTETILDNQEGFITILGNVSNIDTTGTLQGETWVDGDVLYLSPTTPGALTKVPPVSPQHTVTMGYVVYAHQNQGKIFVKVDNGYELDELHNVLITSAANNDLLQYDLVQGVWKNVPPSLAVPAPTLDQVTTAGNTTTNAIEFSALNTRVSFLNPELGTRLNGIHWANGTNTVPYAYLALSGSSGEFKIFSNVSYFPTFYSNGSEAMRIPTSRNVLIGTTTDYGERLQVTGDVRISNGRYKLGGSQVGLYATTDLGLTVNTGSGNSFLGYYATGGTSYLGTTVTLGRLSSLNLNATSGLQEMVRITGNYAPTSGTGLFTALQLSNTINQTGGANGITRGLYVNPTLTSAADFRAIETTSGNVIFNGGNVGIGTTSPASKLSIRSEAATHQLVSINRSTSDIAALYLGNDAQANAIISANNSDLRFGKDLSGTFSEYVRIKDGGNVLIGTTTNAGYKLDVNGSVKATSIFVGDGSSANPSITFYSENGTPNTGIYRIAENELGISVGGLIWTFNSAEFKRDQIYLRANTNTAAAPNYSFGQGYDSTGMFRPVGENTVAFSTSGTEKMRITSAGNVGIGTTTPSYKLEVNGTVSAQLTSATQTDQVYYDSATGELTYGPAAGGTTPTLDQVTTAGNTTTNAITVSQLSITNGTNTGFIKNAGLNNYPIAMDLVMPTSGALRFGAVNFDGPAFQGFHGTAPSYTGQMYFDYGSQQRSVSGRGAFFRNASSPSPVTVMKLTESSNVLIGTTTDSGLAKLQVQGEVSADQYIAAGQTGLTIDIPTGAGQTLHFEGGILTSVI